MKKRFLALILGTVMTASLLAGCGGKTSSGNSGNASADAGSTTSEAAGGIAEGGDFVKGVSTEAPGFDPFTVQTADARSIFFNIYEGLMKTETDGSFKPGLAESCEASDDLQTYTFTLRQGVKFHDGSELDMGDVVYSIGKSITSGINGFSEIDQYSAAGKTYTVSSKKEKNEDGEEVDVPVVEEKDSADAPADDTTLVIHLNKPDSGFPAIATSPIVPKDAEDLAEIFV